MVFQMVAKLGNCEYEKEAAWNCRFVGCPWM